MSFGINMIPLQLSNISLDLQNFSMECNFFRVEKLSQMCFCVTSRMIDFCFNQIKAWDGFDQKQK